jgi:hypothetical protein
LKFISQCIFQFGVKIETFCHVKYLNVKERFLVFRLQFTTLLVGF